MLNEQIMKSTPFSRGIVSVSMVVILAIAAYNWTVSPQAKYLHAAEKYQVMTDNMEKKALSLKEDMGIKERKLESLKQELIEFKPDFFDPSGRIEFFSNLEFVAEQSGCNIRFLTFSSEFSVVTNELDMSRIIFTTESVGLQYTGKFTQVVQFLRYLNDHPKKISVSDLQIESPPDGGTTLDCSMNITIYITENKELATDEKN